MRRPRIVRWLLILSAAVALFGAATGTAAGMSERRLSCQQIKHIVTGVRKTFSRLYFMGTDFPGMAVAVVVPTRHSGALESCESEFGDSNYATGKRVTADTQFELASITKLFTAAVFARAVDQQNMRLDGDVQRYLPSGVVAPSCPGRWMTLERLATHRSGLPDAPRGYKLRTHASYTLAKLYAALGSAHLRSCPGVGWFYSDFGFGLLGQLVVRAEHVPVGGTAQSQGRAFGDLVERAITGPLRMGQTELEPIPPDSRLAEPYFTRSRPAPHWDNVGAMAAGGGFVSSIADMSRFIEASVGSGPKAVVRLLAATEKRVAPGPAGKFQMGLAWQIYRQRWYPAPYLLKFGGSAGMHSIVAIVPKLHIGVAILTNGPTYPLYPAELIMHAVTPKSHTPPRPKVDLSGTQQ